MIEIIWRESNRVSILEFTDINEFSDWAREQAFNSGETIEFITGN